MVKNNNPEIRYLDENTINNNIEEITKDKKRRLRDLLEI